MNDSFDQGQPGFPVPTSASTSGSTSTAASTTPHPLPFTFSGSGSEYFRIWIVNLLLSILTLGIYSAWAKVRRLRYCYDNTQLAGTGFEYHGNPIAILKGRIIAVVLLGLYHFAFNLSPSLGLAAMVAVGVAAPWLLWRSLQFKLYNSSYRGIRFGFRGSAAGAYGAWLLRPLIAVFTGYLALPWVHQRIKRFQHNESRFGATHFAFDATVGSFYKAYLLGIGIWLVGLVVILAGFSGTIMALSSGLDHSTAAWMAGLLLLFCVYAWSLLIMPLFFTLLQNLIWNGTSLGEHRFRSSMRWPRILFISFTNVLGIAVTLGLYTPFAQIRLLRYRIESMTLLAASELDEFVAAAEPSGSAAGEGMSDLFDFDLSL